MQKMLKEVFVFVIVAIVLRNCNGHSYSLGSCPVIEPMTPFNMNRVLGIWYVMQKTSTASTCITYNFTKLEEPDEYEIEQTSQHFILGLTPLKHEYHYTGRLSVPDTAVSARMTVKFPLNVIGKASFTVFMTDYDNYAAVYTCQGLGIGHRDSATILSRTRTLDKVYVDKIRTRLATYNIDPFDLSIISQKDCPKTKDEGININIDDDTFSSQSIAGVVRKAGEKLGDGIEYVAGGAKRVYSTLASGDSKPEDNREQLSGKVQDAAEYIPDGIRREYGNSRQRGDKLIDVRVENNEPTVSSEWLP